MSKLGTQSSTLAQSGQNLSRIVIASYFIGVSLNLVIGTSAAPLFDWLLPAETAEMLGRTVMFTLAFLVLTGLWLRPAALLLAVTVFWSSFMTNLTDGSPLAISAFWRDLAMIGALILTYTLSTTRDAKRRAIFRANPTVRKINVQRPVVPQRIAPKGTPLRANLATFPTPRRSEPPIHAAPAFLDDPHENIFAEVMPQAATA